MVHEGTASPRSRRREANLRRILERAFDLVVEGGLAGLSMAKLASACDYTPGALYRYFDSKDAIVAALVSRVIGELGELTASRRAEQTEPLARVLAALWAYRDYSVTKPHRFAMLAALLASPERMLPRDQDAGPVMQNMIEVLTPVGEDLTSAAAAGQLSPGDVVERAVLLFAATQGVLQLHKQARIAPHLIDLDRLTIAGARSLLTGWGADPELLDHHVTATLGASAAAALSSKGAS